MKQYFFTLLYILILVLLPHTTLHAQAQTPVIGEYTVLAPLPGTTKECGSNSGCTADINSYLNGFLPLVIGIGAMIAMILLGFYGFQYAMSDSASVKMANREKLFEILQGLLLIISAYAIMYTINPELVTFSLEITAPKVTAPGITATSTPGTVVGGGLENTNEAEVRSKLTGISVNAGPCAANQTRGCTNLAGLPQFAVNRLVSLKGECGCDLMITGGTEGGHASHGPGRPKVDLSPTSSLNSYLGVPNPREAQVVVKSISGQSVRFTYETAGGNPSGTSTGNHWHVDIN